MSQQRLVSRLVLLLSVVALTSTLLTSALPIQAAPRQQSLPTTPYPILFVTQVPIVADFTTIGSTFGNHRGSLDSVGRGGDLWIRYPDGTRKNLTAAAGYGIAAGLQSGANAIAVRDPAVHWNGTKAIFSMVMGAPTKQYDYAWQNVRWQLYEITGLGQNETPVITKVPNQPANYNNISPVYGSDGRIIFTTDRPRVDAAHLYPQRDEYELAPTVTGLWSLDSATGDLRLLNHAPSGNFTPVVDSYGRVVFTQWDHLQRDQQADADADDSLGDNQCNNGGSKYGTFNYSDESANATYTLNVRTEVFPEPRKCRQDLLAGTNLQGHSFNHFFPWMINQDGTESEVLNHLGRHELHSYFERSFLNDANLVDFYGQLTRFNTKSITNLFQVKEDGQTPGRYYGVDAPEFGTHAAGQIVRLDAQPGLDADHIAVTYVTRRAQGSAPNHPGLFREPLPLADGKVVAVHTADSGQESGNNTTNSSYEFRLKLLTQGSDGFWTANQPLTSGITKTLSYWSPDSLISYSGILWELSPVEVRTRPTPPLTGAPSLTAGDQQLFTQAGVTMAQLQAYLVQNNLALAVVRNVTDRDDFDFQQPFNLRVPGGTQTLNPAKPGKLYDVTHLQFFQGDQLRGWTGCCGSSPYPGRRVLAQLLHDPAAVAANPAVGSAPAGSAVVAPDGSVAAFVPARRALTWQLTDSAGVGIVRERYWITFQPGEVRVCSSCHGPSEFNQAGVAAASNPPQALLTLLNYWKAQNGGTPTPTPTSTSTPTTTPTAMPTATPTPTATRQPGQTAITIQVEAEPDSIQNFRFTGGLGVFSLDDATPDDNDGVNKSRTVNRAAGVYVISQTVPVGWVAAAITCTPVEKAQVNLEAKRVTVTAAAGDQISCTFVAQRTAKVNARKFQDTNGDKRRQVAELWLAGWTMTAYNSNGAIAATGATSSSGVVSLTHLRPGSYTVCETMQSGWNNTLPGAFTPPYNQPCHPFTLAPNQTAIATFGNRPLVITAGDTTEETPIDESFDESGITISDNGDVPFDESGYDGHDPDAAAVHQPPLDKAIFLPFVQR